MLADRLLAHARTVVTLVVLGVLLVVGATWGFTELTKPVPPLSSSNATVCTDRTLARGDILDPTTVTVSVLNAGGKEGLASKTLDDLADDGFARGTLGNAPTEAVVGSVEIWTTDGRSPAVRLVQSYLGKDVTVRDVDGGSPGVDIVVGDDFTGVTPGRATLKVRGSGATVCSP